MTNRQQFQIIRSLADSPKNFWELIREVDGTIKDLFTNLTQLKQNNIISYEKFLFSLKDQNKHKLLAKKDFEEIKKKFEIVAKKRPPAIEKYFQAAISDEDLLKRLRFIYERGDLCDKEFFILGDDDLFSILLALTRHPKRIVVAEIDKRITNYIKEVKEELNLNIEIVDYDCTNPLPSELKQKFDVFITDPVETQKGFTAFISRGIEALRYPSAVYFGLTQIECPPKVWHGIQKNIINMNFVITNIIRKYSFYPEESASQEVANYEETNIFKKAPFELQRPTVDWYNSSFIRLEAVDTPKPIITDKIALDESFYKNEYVLTNF